MLTYSCLLISILLSIATNLADKQAMPGGWVDQDVNSSDIQELASKAVTKLNAESNDLNYLFPVKIQSAKSHVVQGIEYELKILIGKSTCLKNQVSATEFDTNKCKETNESDRKLHTVRIWQKPWENDFESIEFISNENS